MVFPVYKREVYHFTIWFYPPLLEYDFSLHILLELVVAIPTSPKSSNTEFVRKSYRIFRKVFAAVFHAPDHPANFARRSGSRFFCPREPDHLALSGSSLLSCQTIWRFRPDHLAPSEKNYFSVLYSVSFLSTRFSQSVSRK